MSNYDYEDEDEDFTPSDSSNDLVKQLRKAAKQKDKELQELKSQFESLNKAQRERTIKDALAARGVNQKNNFPKPKKKQQNLKMKLSLSIMIFLKIIQQTHYILACQTITQTQSMQLLLLPIQANPYQPRNPRLLVLAAQ